MTPRKKKAEEDAPAVEAAPKARLEKQPRVAMPERPAPERGSDTTAAPPGTGSMDDRAMAVLQERAMSLSQESEEEEHDDLLSVMLFALGDEWYSVRVDDVREVYSGYHVTAVPCCADHVLGVINIRGEIVSVTDVKSLLRLPAGELDVELPLIVVQKDAVASALVVDGIGEIVEVPHEDVQPPLNVLEKTQAEYITGSIYVDDKLVALINLDKVLAPVGGVE